MLPSKGFFNNFNCPFNEHDVCSRPHCHYRHFKKKKQKPEENGDGNVTSMLANFSADDVNSLLFSEIISEAVQNLLNRSNNVPVDSGKEEICDPLPPSQAEPAPAPVPTYKPTPISELSRRHLPTLYVPSRAEPRKAKSDGSERPAKKKRVQEYKPVASKKYSDQPVPEYCPSSLPLPEAQFSALAEELSFLDNIFDEKDLLESETATRGENQSQNAAEEPQFSSSDVDQNDVESGDEASEAAGISSNKQAESASTERLNGKEPSDSPPTADIDLTKIKEEPNDSSKSKSKNDSSAKDKKETSESKDKEDSSSKKHRSSHSSSRHSSSSRSHKSSDKKVSERRSSHHSSSSRHKSSSKSKDDKNRHSSSSSKSSRHKSSSGSTSKKHSSSSSSKDKDKHSSSGSHSRSKSSSSSKKSSSSSNNKDKRGSDKKHVCNCKYCPKAKKNRKKEESESEASEASEASEQSASENESSSAESVIYCSPKNPKIDLISPSEDESEADDKPAENGSNSEADNDMEFDDAVLDISDDDGPSSGEENLLAKKVLAKLKEVNYKGIPSQLEAASQSKKRVARDSVANAPSSWPQNNYNAPKLDNKKANSLTPTQLMAQRWEKIQQLKNAAAAAASSNSAEAQPNIPGKLRIAHVPNVSSLIERKKEIVQRAQPYPSGRPQTSSNSGSKSTDSKSSLDQKITAQEVFALLKRQLTGNHEKVTESESKIGVEALTLAYSWLYDVEEAQEKAVELEKSVSNAAHQVITYRRALFLKIKSIADQAKEVDKNGRTAVIMFNTYSFTYGHNLYLCFAKFLLTEEDLDMNGYPRPHANPGCALISENVLRKDPPFCEGNKRVCEKCAEPYTVDEEGYPIEGIGKCQYHARKGFIRNRTNRHLEDVRHKCCRQEKGSPGCIMSKFHASHNVDPTCLKGFITFRDPEGDGEKENNVYALDCEMVYTTQGRELARLTIVDVKLRTIFDKLIKPKGDVLDCITQWSGITEAELKTATASFEEVRRYLRKIFNSKTILVGHGLENDLRSMKVVHDKVVDTSVVFPHKYAPQFKESLQKLAEQFLQKLIQTGEETLGHSSEEDARTCMELMLMKIKEDCKQYAPKKVVNLNISRR